MQKKKILKMQDSYFERLCNNKYARWIWENFLPLTDVKDESEIPNIKKDIIHVFLCDVLWGERVESDRRGCIYILWNDLDNYRVIKDNNHDNIFS